MSGRCGGFRGRGTPRVSRKDTCTKGIDSRDPAEHRTPWSCDVIGLKGLGIQRDPVVILLAKWFFGGLGYQGQEIRFVEEKSVFVGLAAFGGKANKQVCS